MQNIKSKLGGFDFNVVCEPGNTTPADYGSRHLLPARLYSARERSELSIKEKEEDAEKIFNRVEEVMDAVTVPILRKHNHKGKTFVLLFEDIKKGLLREEFEQSACKECFTKCSTKVGVMLRDTRRLIRTSLQPNDLAAAHEGYPEKDSMTRQLRESVWWLCMTGDIKEYAHSCLALSSAESWNYPPPLEERKTPIGPWVDCSADVRGPVAGKYYLDDSLDNYSRWPEVEVVKNTSFKELSSVLDRSFSSIAVPVSIIHDRRLPNQSTI